MHRGEGGGEGLKVEDESRLPVKEREGVSYCTGRVLVRDFDY